jgi:biopolymer transport protein ExbB
VWAKPTATAERAVLLSRAGEGVAWRLGLDRGVPFVEIVSGGRSLRTAPGEPVAEGTWKHLAVVSAGNKTTLYVDGVEYGTVEAGIPALESPFTLGGDAAGTAGTNGRFVGEVDELRLSKLALPGPALAFAAVNQSASEKAGRVLVPGDDESKGGGGHNATLEHVMLFGDIAKNMMFDGWIAVGICVLMMIAGGFVAVQKWVYLNKIGKGTAAFLKHWKNVSSDLTAMDLDDPQAARDFGGKLDPQTLSLLKESPLYHVYHIGAEEIRHRLGDGKDKSQGLSARSIQAIRAALDAGLVHEQHRLNKGIIMLTIGIAGGPYVGLLGTVVGVMITFAIIAKSGEVDVNSIAPGIASALLATVFGLLVAIPALFIYSYLNSRIKESLSAMRVFIDEFVAKIAEFYPTPGEAAIPVPIRQIRSEADAEAHRAAIEKDQPKPRN